MILYHYIYRNYIQTIPILQAKRTQNIIKMQLTTIVAFLAAAASAAPGTLSPRASGSVRARFYSDGGCGSNGNDIAQAELILTSTNVTGKAGCRDLTIGPYPAVFFDQSTLDSNTKSKSRHSFIQPDTHWEILQ